MENYEIREAVLFGMGNPLLDIAADVDEEFLKKYDLKPNNAILAEDKHKDIFEEMRKRFEVSYVAGGATQNSIRVAQWLMRVPNSTTYMGCIGDDDYGHILEQSARKDGVNVVYQKTTEVGTGKCAVAITNLNSSTHSGQCSSTVKPCCGNQKINRGHRSLCAFLGAAEKFHESHLDVKEHWALVEKANYFYIAGFFYTVCVPAILRVAKHACDNNKLFSTNLAAPFVCEYFKEQLMQVMPYVDIVFGNETEAATIGRTVLGIESGDLQAIAKALVSLPKINTSRGRTAIITQGPDPIIVATESGVQLFPIIPIAPEKVIDTNGAGDSFVGGFLSQLVQGRDLKECIKYANYAAHEVIQRNGCTFPEKPDVDFIAALP